MCIIVQNEFLTGFVNNSTNSPMSSCHSLIISTSGRSHAWRAWRLMSCGLCSIWFLREYTTLARVLESKFFDVNTVLQSATDLQCLNAKILHPAPRRFAADLFGFDLAGSPIARFSRFR